MRTAALWVAGLFVVLGGPPAFAWDDDQADAETEPFDGGDDVPEVEPPPAEATLAAYGSWIDEPSYGHVWFPQVAVGWRPYLYGQWAWSPYGWTWVSAEPWGPTFHYGRWALAPVGWVWVPGTAWGPAWVDWYWGDGFVGWAPLGPAVTHVQVVDHYVFVPERDFSCGHLSRAVVDHRHVPRHVLHDWPRRRFAPPGRDHIVRVAREPVHRWRNPSPPRGWRRRDQPPPARNGRPTFADDGGRTWQRPAGERGVFRRTDRTDRNLRPAGRERPGMQVMRPAPAIPAAYTLQPAASPPPVAAPRQRRNGEGARPSTMAGSPPAAVSHVRATPAAGGSMAAPGRAHPRQGSRPDVHGDRGRGHRR